MLIRQLIFGVAATSVAYIAAGSLAANAGERLAFPFACSIDDNAVRLKPAAPQELPIVGARQEQVVLACAKGGTAECRTMVAHKFAVVCGGHHVSWSKVAEAVGGRRTSRVWRSGDQLHIALVQPGEPCGAGPAATNEQIHKIPSGACEDANGGELHFVLPADYAPVAHFGARIVGTPNSADASQGGGASSAPQAIVAAQPAQAARAALREKLLARTIVTEPLPELGRDKSADPAAPMYNGHSGQDAAPGRAETGTGIFSQKVQRGSPLTPDSPADRQAPETMAWGATVIQPQAPIETSGLGISKPSRDFDAATAQGGPQSQIAIWLLATVLIGSLGWAAWSRPARFAAAAGSARRATRRVAEQLPDKGHVVQFASDTMARTRASASMRWQQAVARKQGKNPSTPTYPLAGIEEVYVKVDSIVRQVAQELPLRGVLNDELARVRDRLSVAKAAAAGDGEVAQVPIAAYRVLMRDLDRIHRIAESAREGLAAETMAGARMPRNRDEAFDVLGLNPNAGESTAKKVIDALRMSWHPDLAHDADDLAIREERIKQINVASELISEKFANPA